jgi:DUF971 family protein
MIITRFILDYSQRTLMLEFTVSEKIANTQLSFEYLRVNSPSNSTQKPKTDQPLIISHKKDVVITNIESVAKHGFRFIFNDGHSAIYNEDYIRMLVFEHEARWQGYLDELKVSGHSREAIIEIKQL